MWLWQSPHVHVTVLFTCTVLISLKITKKLSFQDKGHKTIFFFFFFFPKETDKRIKHHKFLKAIYLKMTPNFVILQQYRNAEQPRICQTSFLSPPFFQWDTRLKIMRMWQCIYMARNQQRVNYNTNAKRYWKTKEKHIHEGTCCSHTIRNTQTSSKPTLPS